MSAWSALWWVWAGLAAVFAALTAIFAKVGVDDIDPDLATFLRTLVVAVALAGMLAATGKLAAPGGISGRSAVFLVLSGLATGASWLCYFRALKLGAASQVAPVDKMSVVLVALFGFAFLGETLSTGAWIGVALIATGAVLVATS